MSKLMHDDEGNVSSGRWMAMGALFVAGTLAIVPLFLEVNSVDNEVTLYFLLAAFGGKVGQKFAENIKAAKGQ